MAYLKLDQPHNQLFKNQAGRDQCDRNAKIPIGYKAFIIPFHWLLHTSLRHYIWNKSSTWNETNQTYNNIKHI